MNEILELLYSIFRGSRKTAEIAFDFAIKCWNDLPEETKEKIINLIVDSFELFLRNYFRSKV